MNPISQRRQDNKYTDRRCEVCRRQTNGISSLCQRHLNLRGWHGSVKVTEYVKLRDYAHLVKLARKYLKAHPPDQPILDSMARFLLPPDPIPRGSRARGRRERAALRVEMSRWNDPRYRKKISNPNQRGTVYYFKYDYTPTGILCTLIGITAYIDEREGQGFPHDAEAIEKAHAIVRLWKRPRYFIGRKQPVKVSARITASVLRGLAARLREFSMINTFCLVTARAILTEYKATEAARIKALPKHPVYTGPPSFTRWPAPHVPQIGSCPELDRALKAYREWQANERAWLAYKVKHLGAGYGMLSRAPGTPDPSTVPRLKLF